MSTKTALRWSLTFVLALQSLVFADSPILHDDRLELTLVAESPQIMTPIGLAIDREDRLYVLESHTHQRPSNYLGPKTDRVKIFEDKDGDGTFESVHVFADGLTAGMNLAFSPDGVLYVACAREVLKLPYTDQDGICDGAITVLSMQTTERYAHNCLMGLTFDPANNLYVGRGNSGSRAYKFVAADGSRVEGYGDGGSILKCSSDGSHVEEFATGFWNPFEVKFDHAGRLLCVDNDPDARGPNRIVHVVEGGDYGYKSMFGGSGNHPFQAWNGELPGTLPYASGTGEAPCDLIDCQLTSFPADYSNSALVTVWNENTIERHTFNTRGCSLEGKRTTLVSGEKDFRPVAIEANRRGDVFVTDWVKVDYPNHGHGRIWRISSKANTDTSRRNPRQYFQPPAPDPPQQKLLNYQRLALAQWQSTLSNNDKLLEDPFVQHLAIMAYSREGKPKDFKRLIASENPKDRLLCLLALQKSNHEEALKSRFLSRFVEDDDSEIRLAAMVWAGTRQQTIPAELLERAIQGPNVPESLFVAYLAAVQTTQESFVNAVLTQKHDRAKDIKAESIQQLLQTITLDVERPFHLRTLAINRLDTPPTTRTTSSLLQLLDSESDEIAFAAIGKLATAPAPHIQSSLLQIAIDEKLSPNLRCEAILALSFNPSLDPVPLIDLLNSPVNRVAVETARMLRHFVSVSEVADAATRKIAQVPENSPLGQQLLFLVGRKNPKRPSSHEALEKRVLQGVGSAEAGRRVFYSRHATCSGCHTTSGLGAALGPDLSNIAESADLRKIFSSIVRPSESFPPQYQAWQILTTDGRTVTGLQLDHKAGGAMNLNTLDGQTVRFEADEVEDYRASPNSIMPNGLEANLTISEFRDLLAYLESLK